jgi:tetraacyldisaccharide 4'-kinase
MEFVRLLRTEFPNSGLFVSTSTIAGQATAREKLGTVADGVLFVPADYCFAVRRVLRTLQPSIVIVAETEIWPNLFREVKRTRAGLLVVNGRISDRAFPRYQRFRTLFRAVLPHADRILAQTSDIAGRFAAIGAPPARLQVAGNFKYDFEPRPADPESPVRTLIERTRPRAVWIAASTMPPAAPGDIDEDDAVITAYRELARPDVMLILVPRKPERFDVAARKLDDAGIPYVRRSTMAGQGSVLLLDTIGELSGLFEMADVVFMGGTLPARGGHNILEPALFGKPVIVGPHMENFRAIAEDFSRAGASVEIRGASELAPAVARLLDHPEDARAIGERARACAEAERGSTARALAETRALYDSGVPRRLAWQPWLAIALALSQLWKCGGRWKQARGLARRRKLDAPVVSVGNLTMGGTGKTPFVLRLAEILRDRGRHPGILTRGHGRGSVERTLLLRPGAVISAQHSGDEPQIFVRSGLAPVGIGADRFQTGSGLIRQFGVDLLLLDDGFQHVRLARTVDIVLIDSLDPFGGGNLFPAGWLREPVDALARADIVAITRSAFSDLPAAIEREVRRRNAKAPIFRASLQPRVWVQNRTGREFAIADRPFDRAGAFCGLGNPQSFRRTLDGLRLSPVDWVEFDDHHRYRPSELTRIALQAKERGAAALITTEKDAVNLCHDCDELVAPLDIYWLKVTMAIEREDELIRLLQRTI